MTLLEHLNKNDRFAASIGAQLTTIREGYAKAELTVEERHLNGANVCQGGVMYTLADLAFAGVANCHGILTLGISNTITFLKSAKLGDHLTAECTEVLDHQKLPPPPWGTDPAQADSNQTVSGDHARLAAPFYSPMKMDGAWKR